jgi:hypothetical protein
MPSALQRPRATEDPDALLAELEALWAVEAEPGAPRRPGRPYDELLAAVVWGWPAVLVTITLFAPSPSGAYAAWVAWASVALVIGPVLAGLVAISFPAVGLGVSVLLGGTGIAVGIACRATAHHAGGWWAVETCLFAGLAAASLACLALRLRA